MRSRKNTCLRQLAGGRRSDLVRFGRFLSNPRVTVDGLIEGGASRAGCIGCECRALRPMPSIFTDIFRTIIHPTYLRLTPHTTLDKRKPDEAYFDGKEMMKAA
jgi:hypothetical protein